MTDDVDDLIRRAIGGDAAASAWLSGQATTSADPRVVTVAALLDGAGDQLDRARAIATSSRDRQVVEIARAHLEGAHEIAHALAREHLVDFPDSVVVAWIVAGPGHPPRRPDEV